MRFLSYISNMTKNLDEIGLKSIANNYDLFFIDIWGVIHNGIILHNNSLEVLKKLSENKKKFVLLTNAPRPNDTVINFLKEMGLKNYFENVFTSGEAAYKYLIEELKGKKFFHIGPKKDYDLFRSFEEEKVSNIDNSDYLLCSGLFEAYEKDINFYKDFLLKHVSKKMICTNPDLIVDKGEKRELCAGSVAVVFEKMGGKVTYFGKPYPEVYNQSIDNINKKTLSIGDNLNTDIKGANLLNFDSMMITNGIHKEEIRKDGMENVSKSYEVLVNYLQTELKW